jgi:hypothetical protein
MALPPLELFSLREKATLLPGGLFLVLRAVFQPLTRPSGSANRAFTPPPKGRYTSESQADVAQLVEQLIRNQQVTGSNPVVGSSSVSEPINSMTYAVQAQV